MIPTINQNLPRRLIRIACTAMFLGIIFCGRKGIARSQNQPPPVGDSQQRPKGNNVPNNFGVDVLSDTKGVDFGPYLKVILRSIKNAWLPLIPEEGRGPTYAPSDTLIRFTINPDGKVGAMRLESSDHKVPFDRAAWGAIVSSSPFAPLPSQFTGPNLQLRLHFLANKHAESASAAQ